MQAFIHPFLARLFWSSHSNANFTTWSPYDYCNGTFTANRAHTFQFLSPGEDLGEFTFIDFAGSGLVHICGTCVYICLVYQIYQAHMQLPCMAQIFLCIYGIAGVD